MELSKEQNVSEIGRHWIIFLIMGIVAVIEGLYFAMNFGAGFEYIAFMVSVYFMVSGIMSLCFTLQNRWIPAWPLQLILSIISFITGILVITDHFTSWTVSISDFMIIFLCGFGYISEAVSLIMIAVVCRKEFGSTWIFTLILGILLLIMACSIAANPLLLITLINIKVAASVLTFGITSIVIAFQLKKLN